MILFRTDGNATIGSGHIMRCLSIADAAKTQGIECWFVIADESFAHAIRDRGFVCDVLHTDYRFMEQEQDLFAQLLQRHRPNAIVADSYFVTASYLAWLGQFADVTYIDDLAAFAYPVKTLVNYNIYGPKLGYEQLYQEADVPLPQLLLGPQYTPLRKQFQNLPPRIPSQTVKNILVSTGGADPWHIALQIAQYLSNRQSVSRYHFHFVIGAMNPDIAALRKTAGECDWVELHQNVRDMAALMCKCDLAIAAAGSTLYELCACGVPTVTYAFADNQLLGMNAFEEQDIMFSAGDIRLQNDSEKMIWQRTEELIVSKERRQQMEKRMQEIVNGKGALQIVQEIFCK